MNIAAKFQLHPPLKMASVKMIFEYFFANLSFYGNQSNSAVCTKFICLVEDYSRNISVKLLSKYL